MLLKRVIIKPVSEASAQHVAANIERTEVDLATRCRWEEGR